MANLMVQHSRKHSRKHKQINNNILTTLTIDNNK
jgi:hypothetical protein